MVQFKHHLLKDSSIFKNLSFFSTLLCAFGIRAFPLQSFLSSPLDTSSMRVGARFREKGCFLLESDS